MSPVMTTCGFLAVGPKPKGGVMRQLVMRVTSPRTECARYRAGRYQLLALVEARVVYF
jgi:hypothetical protein